MEIREILNYNLSIKIDITFKVFETQKLLQSASYQQL